MRPVLVRYRKEGRTAPRGKAPPKTATAAGGRPHGELRGTALPRREEGYLGSEERRAEADLALAALLAKHLLLMS